MYNTTWSFEEMRTPSICSSSVDQSRTVGCSLRQRLHSARHSAECRSPSPVRIKLEGLGLVSYITPPRLRPVTQNFSVVSYILVLRIIVSVSFRGKSTIQGDSQLDDQKNQVMGDCLYIYAEMVVGPRGVENR
ncbi:hypothetical protein ACFE04_008305 [Oxalis oulophora]